MTEGVRVLELAGRVSAAYAAKLLGDHGADVVKVEDRHGDPARRRGPFPNGQPHREKSGLFLALNVNKRGLCLDLESAAGRSSLLELILWADIVIHSLPPDRASELGLDPTQLWQQRPALVILAITPFGTSGPYSRYEAEELIVANAGGWASLTPSTHTDPDLPPLKVFGQQCGLMSGVSGAMTALAVHRDVLRSGVGEFIDLSEQAYVASVLEAAVPTYGYLDQVSYRHHPRRLIPWKIFHAKDAAIFLICVEDDQWARLVEFMGRPDWATVEIFSTLPGRTENADVIHALIQEFVAPWNALDLYHAAQKHRICFAPVMDYAQLAANEHLIARDFFVAVDHPAAGATVHLGGAVLTEHGRPEIRRPAPLLGQHNTEILAHLEAPRPPAPAAEARLPLAGIRVADFSWAWAGPFCSLNLAHLGAEVIRLESQTRLDIYRRYMINPPGMASGPDTSGMFNQWNQGKRSVSVNLRTAEGIDIAKRIIAESDVVVQNYATGVMDRLGLGYAALRKTNPGIVLASISGYGQSGPFSEYMAYGPAAAPLTGLCSVTGYIGEEEDEIGLSMPDPTAGLTAAWAIVSALARRDATGEGSHLDVSLWEATAVLGAEAWMQHAFDGTQPIPAGNRDSWMAPHGCFPCLGDEAWVAIACPNDDSWSRLARVINADLVTDPRFATLAARQEHEDDLEALVTAWTRSRDRWAVTERLQAQGIAAFPSLSCRDSTLR